MLTRDAEQLLPHTAAEGVGVIAFCPLAQGVLSTKYIQGLPGDSRFAHAGETWHAEQARLGTWKKVAALNDIAQARGQTLPQMALTWLLRDDRVTTVLIGASRLEQVKENLAIVRQPMLTAEELEKIEDILK
jgi:L-glyceraldehyde 3-phosphate reductase